MGKIIQNYSLQEVLGEGSYGKVYKGINLKTKEEVAVKVIRADKFKQIPKLQEFTVNQINTLSSLEPNPHIVRYLDMLKTVNNFYFVYEYCNGGTLAKLMKANPQGLSENLVISYFKQMIEAFKTLTKNNVMHRDLKPDNILIHNGLIKLADFGFCKNLSSHNDLTNTMLGSPIYMAPQVIKGEEYTIKADIWSLGVVLYEMLFGECPFKSSSIAKLIQMYQTDQLSFPKTINPSLEKLLREMLIKDRYLRIDWNQIFEFKIIQTDDNKSLKNYSVFSGSTKNGLSSSNSNTSSNGLWSIDTSKNIKKSPMKIEFSTDLAYRGKTTTNLPQSAPNKPVYSGITIKAVENRSNMEHYLNNHKKTADIIKLSLQSLKHSAKDSIIVSFFLCKSAEKELLEIMQHIKQEQQAKSLKVVIDKEVDLLQQYLRMYRCQLQSEPDHNQRSRYLKSYIQSLRLQQQTKLQEFVHASQLLDYFQESILLKKDAYQRLTREQLHRQLQSKLTQIK